jgi:hypothetical protein
MRASKSNMATDMHFYLAAAGSGSSSEDMTSGQDAQSALLELDKGTLCFLHATTLKH